MEDRRPAYYIVATKRRSEAVVEGITYWDGLSSLHYVTTAEGTNDECVSVLDNITTFKLMKNHSGHLRWLRQQYALSRDDAEIEAARRYIAYPDELNRWGKCPSCND